MNENELLKIFSKNLKRLMEEENMFQEDLANEIGVSREMISRYMNGHSLPSFITIIKMSEALFCSLDDFIK